MSSKLSCCGDSKAVNSNSNIPKNIPEDYLHIINLLNDLKIEFNNQINDVKSLIETNRCQCQSQCQNNNNNNQMMSVTNEQINELKDIIISNSCHCTNEIK